MPYYVFAVRGFGQLELLGEHAQFKVASAQAKALRAELGGPTAVAAGQPAPRLQVMFGETQLAAEDQLLAVREARPEPDDA